MVVWFVVGCGQPDTVPSRWPEVEARADLAACAEEPPGLRAAFAAEPEDPARMLEALRAWHAADPAAVTRPSDPFRWLAPWTSDPEATPAVDDIPLMLHAAASVARCGGQTSRSIADALVLTACAADPRGTRTAGGANAAALTEAWDRRGMVAREALAVWELTAPMEEGLRGPSMRRELGLYLERWALDGPLEAPPAPTGSRLLHPALHLIHQGADGIAQDTANIDPVRVRCTSGPTDVPFVVADPSSVGVLVATSDPEVGLLRVPADGIMGLPERAEGVPWPAPVPVGDLGEWWVVDGQGVLGAVTASDARLLTTCENDGGIRDEVEARVGLGSLARRPEPETVVRVLGFALPYPPKPLPSGGSRLSVDLRHGPSEELAIEVRVADPPECGDPEPAVGVRLNTDDGAWELRCCGP